MRNADWDALSENDGHYAIAVAILELANAIHRLGNADAMTSMGAIEGLAAHLGEKIAGAGEAIASAIIETIETGENK